MTKATTTYNLGTQWQLVAVAITGLAATVNYIEY
jgi:hypothetical protein